MKDFLRQEEVQIHFTKPNSHTGNADIGRFHNTLGERFRMLEIENSDLTVQEKVYKCTEWYNKSIHSVIRERPVNIANRKIVVAVV